ncbi:MAG: hypothetical protein RIB52_01640 [Erythrobacter sp.]
MKKLSLIEVVAFATGAFVALASTNVNDARAIHRLPTARVALVLRSVK